MSKTKCICKELHETFEQNYRLTFLTGECKSSIRFFCSKCKKRISYPRLTK
ncbi:MAG: hypothetical protein HQ536_05165 [Parcubacteria group bacterium]|nr:hypothetical protein [Parcubacteria group bacterium]